MTLIFDGLEKAKLLDEVYMSGNARNTGTFVSDFHGYFKKWDKEYGIIYLYLTKDTTTDRIVALPASAVTWIKDAITGEFVYQKDPRAMIFGSAL